MLIMEWDLSEFVLLVLRMNLLRNWVIFVFNFMIRLMWNFFVWICLIWLVEIILIMFWIWCDFNFEIFLFLVINELLLNSLNRWMFWLIIFFLLNWWVEWWRIIEIFNGIICLFWSWLIFILVVELRKVLRFVRVIIICRLVGFGVIIYLFVS